MVSLFRYLFLYCCIGSFCTLAATEQKSSSLNFYVGKGVYNYLDRISADAHHGTISFANTYIYSLSYAKTTVDISHHFKMGYEMDIAKHFGLQENGEVGILWLFILKGIFPDNRYLECDLTYGEGFSYAIGVPSFEDGPSDDPTRRYHFQSFLIFDFDFYLPKYPNTHLFYRVHHRSGIYGLITPDQVGSNFIGLGIKHLF